MPIDSSPAMDADEKFEDVDDWAVDAYSSTSVPFPPQLKLPNRPATASPQISTLRRKTDALFDASNPFDADESEFGELSPLQRQSTLRRKTDALISGGHYSSNPFDPDKSEFEESSPSLRPSTLGRKTDELVADRQYSPNPFAPDESEYDEPSSNRTVRTKPIPSPRFTLAKHIDAAVSLMTAQAELDGYSTEQTDAVTALSKAHLGAPRNTSIVSPGLSTMKRESADFFAKQGKSFSNIWEDDEEEFVAKLETMRLNPTQRIRGKPLKPLRTSPSPLLLSPTVGDKKNVPSSQSARLSPLWSVFDAPEPTSYTPKKLSLDAPEAKDKDGGPAKSIWDADEDEFDRWPDEYDLAATVKSFTAMRGTYNQPSHRSTTLKSNGGASEDIPPVRGANMTEQEHDDFMHELLDKNRGNPDGVDAHDEVMQQFYQRDIKLIPASNPAGYPHIVGVTAYMQDEDRIVQTARPRLADIVVTVLHLTHAKCLTDFLDSAVKIFEWRRAQNSVLIRREGNEVIVGTYQNYGTCYVWTYFVRSQISETGSWKEVYAGASQITMPVSAEGIQFEQFVAEPTLQGIDPEDKKYALYMGRVLGGLLLEKMIWDHPTSRITWEVDGKVINAREYVYEALRFAREEQE